jgi:hypothetical protein
MVLAQGYPKSAGKTFPAQMPFLLLRRKNKDESVMMNESAFSNKQSWLAALRITGCHSFLTQISAMVENDASITAHTTHTTLLYNIG